MRTDLKNIGETDRHTFTGRFARFGEKRAYKSPIPDVTVLLLEVKDTDGNMVADHLWFNYTKGFKDCNLAIGDIVQFDARVKEYEKGYKGHRYDDEFFHPVSIDYKLSHPTKISVIEHADNPFVCEPS